MKNYLSHLQSIGDNEVNFQRKIGYIKYNFGKYIKELNSKSTVLEIGPGSGAVECYLNSNSVTNIDLIDNDLPVLKYVQNKYTVNKVFQTSDLSKIKSKLQKYDLIFMLQVFEHIPRDQYVSLINVLVGQLKKDGKIIIMVPNGGNPLGLLERYHDLQHENAYTTDSLYELTNYCGVSGVSSLVEGYKIPPYNIINLIRIILQKILHLLIIMALIVNGGVYQTIMTPNITLIISKK